MALPVSYEEPAAVRQSIAEAISADFHHIVLILPAPYPVKVVQGMPMELIATSHFNV